MLYIVDYFKAIACFLITNFHLDIVFPANLSLLAFGGDIGNNIFFCISGFTLVNSVCRHKGTMLAWYKVRLKKLLPFIVFFSALSILIGDVKITDMASMFSAFVFPTIYWFTGAIVIFYVLFFYCVQNIIKEKFSLFLIVAFLLYFLIGGIYAERYVAGFIAMAVGAWARLKCDDMSYSYDTRLLVIATVVLSIMFVVLKVLKKHGFDPYMLISFVKDMDTVLIAVAVLMLGYAYNESMAVFSEKHILVYKAFRLLSQITLPVYLVQVTADRFIFREIQLVTTFPISYICCFGATIGIAWLLSKLESRLHRI